MQIYCFYTNTLTGLEPRLYAFTHKKSIALEFAEARKGLRQTIKKITKDEYSKMRARLDNLYIIEDLLVSKDSSGHRTSVRVFATTGEVMDFRAHADAIATIQLGQLAMDTSIFEDGVREALNKLGMQQCYDSYYGNYPPMDAYTINFEEVEQPRLWSEEYCLDEFEVFVKHRWNTFFNGSNK